jgi:hypothetical protein
MNYLNLDSIVHHAWSVGHEAFPSDQRVTKWVRSNFRTYVLKAENQADLQAVNLQYAPTVTVTGRISAEGVRRLQDAMRQQMDDFNNGH